MRIPRRYRRSGGFILGWVMLVILVLVTIGAGLSALSTCEGVTTLAGVDGMQCFNLAEAGLEWGTWQLSRDTDWEGGTLTLNGDACAVTAQSLGSDWYRVTAHGTVNGVEHTCSLNVRVEVSQASGWPLAMTDFAIYWAGGGSGFTLNNNVIIDGPVFANGDVTVNNNAGVINGSITTTGSVSGRGTYTATAAGEDAPEPFAMDLSAYNAEIATANSVGSRSLTLNGNTRQSLGDATVYVDGNVTLGGNLVLTGPGRIIATGNITVENNAILLSSIDLIAGGRVTIENNGLVEGQGNTIYGGNGVTLSNNAIVNPYTPISLDARGSTLVLTPDNKTLTLDNNANIRGVVRGGQLDMSNNAIITGSLYADRFSSNTMINNAHVNYDPDVFDGFEAPSGLPVSSDGGGEPTVSLGTWSESETAE